MSWSCPPFNASDFTASPSGLWTVQPEDVIVLAYKLVDADTMALNWIIGNTNVSGSPMALAFRIPGGYRAVKRVEPLHYWEEGWGGKYPGWFDINPNDPSQGTTVKHYKFPPTGAPIPWKNTTARDTSVHGSIVFEVAWV